MNISSKLPEVGTTIFTVMSSLAAEHNAVNLGQGFPDFPMSAELTELVSKAMRDGHNQYVHMNGLPLLRERIAEKVLKLYSRPISPADEITVTPGGTYALYTALTTILQPGDEVIVFEPAYDCYVPQIELNGATAVTVPLTAGNYKIDQEKTRAALSSRTRAIMINSPHNPSGAVMEQDEIDFLKEATRGTNIIIISDEVYEHIIFDGKKHLSVLLDDELYARSFVVFSVGKTYNCTGWKTGYCIAPPAMMSEFRKVHQFNAFTHFSPVQVALADFIQRENEYLQLGPILQQKRDYLLSLMKDTAFKPLPSYGSYFQLYTYEGISELSEYDMAVELVKKAGVATIPVSSFYRNLTDAKGKADLPVPQAGTKLLRFCFAKENSTLEAATQRLKKIYSK